jgi:hypothetical protein
MTESQVSSQNRTGTIVLAWALALVVGASIHFALQSHHRGVELVDVHARLQQTTAQLQDANARLSQAQGRIAQLQTLAERSHRLPVTTMVGRARDGSGYDLRIQNRAPHELEVGVLIFPKVGAIKSYSYILNPNSSRVFDKLGSRDRIQITSDGFDPVIITMPL